MKELLYFSTPWCGPCKMFGPVVSQTVSEIGMSIKKIDADAQKELTEKYSVKGVPTLILLRNGIEIKRHMGALSKKQLLQILTS